MAAIGRCSFGPKSRKQLHPWPHARLGFGIWKAAGGGAIVDLGLATGNRNQPKFIGKDISSCGGDFLLGQITQWSRLRQKIHRYWISEILKTEAIGTIWKFKVGPIPWAVWIFAMRWWDRRVQFGVNSWAANRFRKNMVYKSGAKEKGYVRPEKAKGISWFPGWQRFSSPGLDLEKSPWIGGAYPN